MIFITGGNGQVGFELSRVLTENKIPFRSFNQSEWNITDDEESRKILSEGKPVVLINAAAFTAVDKAESEPESAFSINGRAPGKLARLCNELGILFVHISTDFIFHSPSLGESAVFENFIIRPWKPDSHASTEGVYARSKKQGEDEILKLAYSKRLFLEDSNTKMKGIFLIRTSWVYSTHGNNFPKTILKLLQDPNRPELRVIEDQIGRPTYAKDLASYLYFLVKNYLGAKLINPGLTPEDCIGGIYHFSNSGIASWYDFAFEIQNLALKKGILKSPKPIIPIATEDYPLPAPRPNYSVLDLTESRIQYSIPHWRDALERMMSELN